MQKQWKLYPSLPPEVKKELSEYHPAFQQILYNRGVKSRDNALQYLATQVNHPTDPFLIRDMDIAVERINYAIHSGETIAIYGDFDADGVTASALMYTYLARLTTSVIVYIPDRFEEGYGLNMGAIKNLSDKGVNLILTVDCGIRSIEEVAFAKKLGIDVIIVDHHHPAPTLPEAVAVIDPKRPDDQYPYKHLAGVGLAYKVVCALIESRNEDVDADEYLDFVALGTVADLAPLNDENRKLVKGGLDKLNTQPRQGIFSLINVAGITPGRITSTHIGYMLGPRLNAAGRIDSAYTALKLLVASSAEDAGRLALQLDNHNRHRQRLTAEIQEKAEQMAIEDDSVPYILFAGDPEFNPGVVGLAASRLTEKYYRPAIVAFIGEKYSRGSCRSIPEFHITKALDQCSDLLVQHGGHAAAAGFTVSNKNLPLLKEKLYEIAEQELKEQILIPTIDVDVEIPLSEIPPEIIHDINRIEPVGIGNPSPLFLSRNVRIKNARLVGADGKHLKLVLEQDRVVYDAIAFNFGDYFSSLTEYVDIVYSYEINEYMGRQNLQLNIIDIKPVR